MVSVQCQCQPIRKINLKDKAISWLLRSILQVAIGFRLCLPQEDFEFVMHMPRKAALFCLASQGMARGRLVAPSLKLDPNAENYPFSVKPDKPGYPPAAFSIFKDYTKDSIRYDKEYDRCR